MNLKKILFISLTLFLFLHGNVTLAASCQCTDRATAVAGACEKKSESDCYAQLNGKVACSFFTDDACKKIKDVLANGLAWTEKECKSAKADWLPPEGGANIGPYCYEPQDFAEPYKLKVDILNVNKEEGGIKNLGQYINLIYKLVVGLAIFFAIIMTTVAGFKWLTSGGNSGKIGEAKKMIVNAIIGLIIAAGAYTILQTINPRLLELHLPLIPKIKTINYVGVRGCEGYRTQGDCEKNPVGFNSGIAVFAPAGYSGVGCAWDAASNSCVQKEFKGSGYLGGLCLADKKCNGSLKCVSTANIQVCTDGNANSVCGYDQPNNGCKEGLKCDTSLASICYDPNCKNCRPQGVPCDQDSQCGSGSCSPNGRCTIPSCKEDQCPAGLLDSECRSQGFCAKGQLCLSNDGSPIKSCQRAPTCSTQGECDKAYGPGYFCPAELYITSKTEALKQYTKNKYALSISGNYIASSCIIKKGAGDECAANNECKTGVCATDPSSGSIFLGKCT